MAKLTREERLAGYRIWEAEFLSVPCAAVYPYSTCAGRWLKNKGPGMDFLCPVCGRWVDAKYSGTMVRFGLVRFNCSANPWMHYLPTSTLAIRTAWDRHPSSVSCLRADGRIVEGHAASANGTKEYGDTDYVLIEAPCYPIVGAEAF